MDACTIYPHLSPTFNFWQKYARPDFDKINITLFICKVNKMKKSHVLYIYIYILTNRRSFFYFSRRQVNLLLILLSNKKRKRLTFPILLILSSYLPPASQFGSINCVCIYFKHFPLIKIKELYQFLKTNFSKYLLNNIRQTRGDSLFFLLPYIYYQNRIVYFI